MAEKLKVSRQTVSKWELDESTSEMDKAIELCGLFNCSLDKNPFVIIPNAYKTLMEYMRINGLEHTDKDVISHFETDGDTMDVYIACV